jgi:hypothetical protein
LSIVYLSSLAFAGTALVSAFFLTDVSKYMTGFVNKRVDGASARVEKVEEKELAHDV